jgi:hypothetical protein
MKTTNDRIKMAITFSEYETKLMRATAKIVCGSLFKGCEKKDSRRIIMLALLAYCRGVIEAGDVSKCPVIATALRLETPQEVEQRCAGAIPNQSNYHTALETLAAKNEELANQVRDCSTERVGEILRERVVWLAILRGETELIKKDDRPLLVDDVMYLMKMDSEDRAEAVEDVESEIAELREYLEKLSEPAGIKTEAALTDAELDYCSAEDIPPADFLKSKSRK